MATCEHSGLDTSGCDHCRRAAKPAYRPVVVTRVRGPIEARHRGQCAGCGTLFAAGALIVPNDTGWLAECCADEDGAA